MSSSGGGGLPEKPKGLVDLVEQSAKDALEGFERGMTRGYTEANAALTSPEGADLAPLLTATDLPELPADGALGSLGVRLDREADLHRNVALRELARVAWMDRVTLLIVVSTFIGEALVAAAVTMAALTGSEGRIALFALAAIILAGSAAGVAAITARGRASHHALAIDALKRARIVEGKIYRLAIAMEWRVAGPVLFQDALARLERDANPTPAPATVESVLNA